MARTVTQLTPGQVGQRGRLRAQRAALNRQLPVARRWLLSGTEPGTWEGWPAGFTPLDARIRRDWPGGADPRGGEISLLGAARVIAPADGAGMASWEKADWEMAGEPLLWRFHLYYWDWAWPLAVGPRRQEARAAFAAMWESWRAAVAIGRGPAWHAYPAALRAWSFCGLYRALAEGSPIEEEFRRHLAAHAGFLRRNLETDVGGNHLIKDLKALVGLAVFFADDALLDRALGRLRRQLAVQVLSDGGHYERAPAYHCQVLADLIDIRDLLRTAGRDEPTGLAEAIGAMRGWLGAVLTPQGDVPMLNDGFPVSPELLAVLEPAAPPTGPLHVLPATGLARATAGGWHLLADIGLPCPRGLPAHAHADTLGFVLHVDGEPLLIDTGTSSYAPGASRNRERSTAAHNTVEVDGRDSTEVWGAFRAGRRARILDVSASERDGMVTVEAAHDGYRGLRGRPRHRRRWSLRAHELRVEDIVTGRGLHRITARWHLAPDTVLRLAPGSAVVTTRAGEVTVTVTATGEAIMSATTAEAGAGFGRTVPVPVLACELHSELPLRISTVWQRANPQQEPS
jgi:uncharacterized heparinase superfamily protein